MTSSVHTFSLPHVCFLLVFLSNELLGTPGAATSLERGVVATLSGSLATRHHRQHHGSEPILTRIFSQKSSQYLMAFDKKTLSLLFVFLSARGGTCAPLLGLLLEHCLV